MWPAVDRFFRKLRYQGGRERFRLELAEELEYHRELKLRENSVAGLPPEEVAAETNAAMGNITLAVEESADVRSFVWFEQLVQDIRHSLRLMGKNFGFSLVASLSLALGIGGSTAVFSMVNALLVKPLPFADPARLVRITEFFPKALLVHFQQQSRTMDIVSVGPGREANVTGQGPAFRITVSMTSANLFSVLGVPVVIGESFEAGDNQPGRDRVAILSHDLWQSRFNSDPNVIGRIIAVDGIARRIIGVMPAGFRFPSARVQLWYPFALDPSNPVDYWGIDFNPLIGRLRPGATVAQAAGEVASLARNVWRMFPWPMPRGWNSNSTVISLQTDLAGDARRTVLLLLCAVSAVLVIACANVAGLLLARAGARRKEIALRAALGAGRFRIVRQLLTECVVLAGVAGTVGLFLGASALRLFRAVVPPELPGTARIEVDWNVVGFAVALSILSGVAFGLAPALSASRLNLVEVVKTGGLRSGSVGSLRFRSWLIGGEIALTLVLVIGAGLLIRSLYAISTVDPGYHPQRLIGVKISPDASFCKEAAACLAFYDRLLADARQIPGVTGAVLANTLPLDGTAPELAVDVEDHPKTADFPSPVFWTGAVTPEYLRLMGIPLVAGRGFQVTDTRDSEPVVLVTAWTAKRYWPGQNPIGKHIKDVREKGWRTVVGVVADIHQFSVTNRTPSSISGALYMPYGQAIDTGRQIPAVMNLIVRTTGGGTRASDELHRVAAERNPNVPVGKVVHLDRLAAESVSNFRSTTWLFLAFAGVALVLATTGIYGLVSYSVAQRAYEISLRMAIGATSGSIVGMILARSLRLALVGLAVGLACAFALIGSLSGLLFGVTATDPMIYGSVSVLLLCVSALASLVPAWKASRMDPIRTLRSE